MRPVEIPSARAPRLAFLLAFLLGACAPAPVGTPPPREAPPEPPPEAPPPEQPAAPPGPEPEDTARYLIMISFDGMRYDFLDRVHTPGFDRVAAAGVRAAALIPSYPSKTFPNHYTLATGLYPANHGIVDNAFYDPAFDATYSIGDRASVEDGRWYGGEPIWKTAERQGLATASFFWVGSEAEGLHPTYWKVYDGSVPNAARVDTVLAWLELPEERRPRLIMLYFSEVDDAGHRFGPDADQVDSAIVAMDGLLNRLLDGLAFVAVGDQVNLVLVSDHGMAPVPAGNIVFLEDYADLSAVRVVDNATQALLYVGGDENILWSTYDALNGRVPHADVRFREELPERWRYGHSRRVGELVVTADPGWMVAATRARPWSGGGMHGWDPYLRAMRGIFLAAGPGVRAVGEVASFENVHVHPFAAALLGIDPAPGIDGTLEVLGGYLATPANAR